MKKYDSILIYPSPEKDVYYFCFQKNSKIIKTVCVEGIEMESFKQKHNLTDMFKPKIIKAIWKGKIGTKHTVGKKKPWIPPISNLKDLRDFYQKKGVTSLFYSK